MRANTRRYMSSKECDRVMKPNMAKLLHLLEIMTALTPYDCRSL